MRFYTVHIPAREGGGDDGALGRAVLVREGFNWLAFFFAPFWALGEGLWLAALPLIAALGAIIAVPLVLGLGPVLPVVLGLGYAVLAGMSANDLRRAGLAARGYRLGRGGGGAEPRAGADSLCRGHGSGVDATAGIRRCGTVALVAQSGPEPGLLELTRRDHRDH